MIETDLSDKLFFSLFSNFLSVFCLDLFLSEKTVAEVIEKFQHPLLNPEEFAVTVDTCASLAAYISAIVYSEKLCLKYGDNLLLALFSLSCNTHVDSECLSKDTLWEVSTAWQDALMSVASRLNKEEFLLLVEKFANVVEEEIAVSSVQDVNVEHFVGVLVDLVRCCQKCVPLWTNDVLMVFLEQEFFVTWRDRVRAACLWAEYIAGNIIWDVRGHSQTTEGQISEYK